MDGQPEENQRSFHLALDEKLLHQRMLSKGNDLQAKAFRKSNEGAPSELLARDLSRQKEAKGHEKSCNSRICSLGAN